MKFRRLHRLLWVHRIAQTFDAATDSMEAIRDRGDAAWSSSASNPNVPDPTYGAHLVVQPQVFSGTPPVASAAVKPEVRAYPTPNNVVTDYAVNEFVVLVTARGALLAVKVG